MSPHYCLLERTQEGDGERRKDGGVAGESKEKPKEGEDNFLRAAQTDVSLDI